MEQNIIWYTKHTLGDKNLIDCDLNESFVRGRGRGTLDEVEGTLEYDKISRGQEL